MTKTDGSTPGEPMASESTRDGTLTGEDVSLLIVDDDAPFVQRLGRAMEKRGFAVETAETVREANGKVEAAAPAYAVIDMRLDDGNGLTVVEKIRKTRPDARTVVLTGYGNIATAVTAVKLGAIDYLSKPADADEIGAVHAELFSEAAPAATMVVVAALLDPAWKVEVEAEAVLESKVPEDRRQQAEGNRQ